MRSQVEKSAMAVVLLDKKILTIVEDIYGYDVLSLPKGHQEKNEELLDTAIRECFEETNYQLDGSLFVKKLRKYHYEFTTPNKFHVKKIIYPYLFKVNDPGDLQIKEERIKEVKWMDLEEFSLNCKYDNVKKIANYLLKQA